MKLSSTSTEAWTERYEALRRCAQEQVPRLAAPPLGLILLARQGMAGWMRQWAQTFQSPLSTLRETVPQSSAHAPPPPNQLIGLLAQMTAAHL